MREEKRMFCVLYCRGKNHTQEGGGGDERWTGRERREGKRQSCG